MQPQGLSDYTFQNRHLGRRFNHIRKWESPRVALSVSRRTCLLQRDLRSRRRHRRLVSSRSILLGGGLGIANNFEPTSGVVESTATISEHIHSRKGRCKKKNQRIKARSAASTPQDPA